MQRVVPEPRRAEPDPAGVTYTWPVVDTSGLFNEEIQTDPEHRIRLRSVTLP